MRKPLAGVRVVSLAINLPGPLAAARLAELGADVVGRSRGVEAGSETRLQSVEFVQNGGQAAGTCLGCFGGFDRLHEAALPGIGERVEGCPGTGLPV